VFAINHAATGLIIKRMFPEVPMTAILVSVQLIEGLWVVLNFLGIEKTTTENRVESVSDVHLEYMPYSHSVLSTVVLALGAWNLFALCFKSVDVGTAVALGICSHLVLDLLSHARDIVLAPFLRSMKFGLGLYEKPSVAFTFETIYGIFCWWVYGGRPALFWIIVVFNAANASFFIRAIPGPERLMANRPSWITGTVAVQILATAGLVGVFS
jgi:LexA-binding, inner membrane-associated putative hydrolase